MRVYIINGRVTGKNIDDILHCGHFMGYADTTGDILCWNSYQPSVVCRAHHVWFYGYNSCLSIEDNHTPGSLLIQKYP